MPKASDIGQAPAAEHSATAISLVGVHKRLGALKVLRNVNARFEASRVSVILGANGVGKSTLLSIVAGAMGPDEGVVQTDKPGDEIRVGYLGHGSFLYGELTARENLDFWAQLGAVPAAVLSKWINCFEVTPFLDRSVRHLSRGQSQRVSLARAFASVDGAAATRWMVLDEPTTGLDRRGIGALSDVIAQAIQGGVGVILSTHEPSHFAGLPTDWFELTQGSLRVRRSPGDSYRAPVTEGAG